MCGITGYIGIDLSESIASMVASIHHRGPDDEGSYIGPSVGLAMRRLAIIGIESGHQPMFSADKQAVVVFNGEIYNYIELRDRLREQGHKFYTDSDTEVIVRLYERDGLGFVHQLRGMFAIAIWDKSQRRMILARDRIGEKPLFYSARGSVLVFGSEPKCILHASTSVRPDSRTICQFMKVGFAPGDRTFFSNIKKVKPGTMLIWENGTVGERRYWATPSRPKTHLDYNGARAELSHLLDETVQICLRSDVEVASFLSGGVDSSLITALAAKHGANLQTFSVGYSGEAVGFNELSFAKEVSEKLGTKHHELILDAKSNIELLPTVLRHFDEPHGEPTSILVYQLCKFVSQYVKVALGGTGGDELFFGYPRHKGIKYQAYYHKVPEQLRRLFTWVVMRAGRESTKGGKLGKRIRKFLAGAEKTSIEAYSEWVSLCDQDVFRRLLVSPPSREVGDQTIFETVDSVLPDEFSVDDLLDAAFRLDISGYLPEYQLAYMDRMSMAASLEVRSPLCDMKVVEYASQLPVDFRLKGFRSKHILKDIATDLVPSRIANRPKVGFDSPIGQWFKTDLRRFCESFLASDQVEETGIFVPAGVESVLYEHLAGRRDHSLLIWSIIATECWHRMYIETELWKQPGTNLEEIRGAVV